MPIVLVVTMDALCSVHFISNKIVCQKKMVIMLNNNHVPMIISLLNMILLRSCSVAFWNVAGRKKSEWLLLPIACLAIVDSIHCNVPIVWLLVFLSLSGSNGSVLGYFKCLLFCFNGCHRCWFVHCTEGPTDSHVISSFVINASQIQSIAPHFTKSHE